MQTFLEQVAKDLINKYGHNLAKIAVVFPNKRASLFLNQELAKCANAPLWSPAYITISELFRRQSALTVGDPIKILCELYKSYRAITESTEDFDQFYGWGQIMLGDFDDLDKHMADAKMVFRNIENLHELDTINYLSEEQKEELRRFFSNFTGNDDGIKRKFLQFWTKLNAIYDDFKSRLRAQQLAYEGMLYREVIEENVLPDEYEKYVFVGFNVIQPVEQQLFTRLKKEDKAFFYWDYDQYFLQPMNEAGGYIRKWLTIYPNELQNAEVGSLYDNFTKEKDIRFISAPTENLQARYVTNWLLENKRYKEGKKTAIVMCDENLLQTVIHCIPSEVEQINVTTGYPLHQTPISSMVSQLLSLQTEGYSQREKAYRLHYLNRVLRHPYGKYLVADADQVLKQMNDKKQYYIPVNQYSLLRYVGHEQQNIEELVSWLAEMVKEIAKNNAETDDQLFQESTFRMYTLLNRLAELIKAGDLTANYTIFKRLLNQLVGSTSIPFHGEPARGVQVMGVLETRNLDFKNVVLLSCNEGNMPKGVNDTSFIPYFIRKAYELTTIDNKVAIYSYYFHSLLQRAENVTILYNNSTSGSQTGEMSRFMLQMMVDLKQPIRRLALQAGQEPMKGEAQEIIKNDVIMAKLDELSYISPTAFNTYKKCPLMFYYKYITELVDNNETDEDDIDGRVFGNIFHYAAELVYEKLLPREVITKEHILSVLKTGKSAQTSTSIYNKVTLNDVIDEAFSKELFLMKKGATRHPKLNGLQLINREVIEKYLKQLLRLDAKVAPLRVIEHEFRLEKELIINVNGAEKRIKIGGRVDRLDEIRLGSIQEQRRILDYKTGASTTKPIKTIEDMFNVTKIASNKSDYMLQAMLYSILEAQDDIERNPNHLPVSPALLFIQKSGAPEYSPTLALDGEEILDAAKYAETFYDCLKKDLEEIFTKELAFSPTPIVTTCTYCPYKQFCGR